MPAKTTRPYGSWPSPISAALAARASRRFGMVQASGNAVYWSEARPEQGGRQTLMRLVPGGEPEELLAEPYSARSRIHEYGGGEFLVAGDIVYFCNNQDQQIFALAEGRGPRRITRTLDTRFADFALDAARGRLIAVAERHASGAKPSNLLVSVALSGRRGQVTELAAARDFYASPKLSPDGGRLAFLAWDLPNMPWDSAALYLARVREDGRIGRPRKIAGGDGSFAFQPEWGPDGHLYFVSDSTGWGALYRWQDGRAVPVHGRHSADLSRAQWALGMRSYALHADGSYAAVFLEQGSPVLEIGQLAGGAGSGRGDGGAQAAARIDYPTACDRGFAALVATSTAAPAVMRITCEGPVPLAPQAGFDPACISRGEARSFQRPDGELVHGLYYAPTNPSCRGPSGSRPPALVFVHGGPTSMADASLKMGTQFYTSRGFAVFDVNYSGSIGYGRSYRRRLDGQWGIADVEDCAAAARYLAREGLADAGRIAISGGSAGGYTVLMALATTDVFAAGSSHYGVSDLRLLLEHTHKFESGYLHRLMGTTPRKWREVFAARSPLHLAEQIRAPLILFQGLEDKVVPPEQSRFIAEKLGRRGVPVAYREFPGEGHGFRAARTIVAVLEAELAFWQRVLRLKR